MHENSIQEMTAILRNGIVNQEPSLQREGTVECDEVYVVAGHKGHPESVKKKGERPAAFLHCLRNGDDGKGREAEAPPRRTSRRPLR